MRKLHTALCTTLLVLSAATCGGDAKKADKKAAKDEAGKDEKTVEPKVDEKKAEVPDEATIARGTYLAESLMNCRACHTPLGPNGPDLEREYAGGLEFPDTFGTWRSPNITQDEKTGIGGWTDEQIIDAIRLGKRPSGEQMYPMMPYPYFNRLSDTDAKALVAYLRTIKPVENAIEGNTDLKLAKPEVPAPEGNAPGTELTEQGEYLATLAHCGGCHTPLAEDGSLSKDKHLAGGNEFRAFEFQGTGSVWSANITPDEKTGVGKYSDEELINAITQLDKQDGSSIVGPMTFYTDAWSSLAAGDVKAIAAYLKTVDAVENEVPKPTWKPAAAPKAGE
jgi:mono/diheme cytochrome c family protein